MIVSPGQDLIVSHLGWCDGGNLWVLETSRGRVSTHSISNAKYLSLHGGMDDYFSVVHHYDSDRLCISAHSFSDPAKTLAQVTVGPVGTTFEGDITRWSYLPRAYVAFLSRAALSDFHLFLIEPVRPTVEIIGLDWYDDSYDKGYQGIIGAVEVPGEDKVIISVQRDSRPVLYDLDQRKVISRLSLADRGGNPTLRFTRRSYELWADDYDTLLRIDPSDWNVKDKMLLQGTRPARGPAVGECRQFIGEYTFAPDESLCAVARPFSGDVIALNMKKFKVTHACPLGRQPLLVAVLDDGTVYGRDYKTGTLLMGCLKRKWIT